jgi:hypothetical protein
MLILCSALPLYEVDFIQPGRLLIVHPRFMCSKFLAAVSMKIIVFLDVMPNVLLCK